MNEATEIKKLIKNLEEKGLIKRFENKPGLIKYSFTNKDKKSLGGMLVVSSDFDVFYMSFDDLSNKRFASGELLDANDVERFIMNAINGPVSYGKSFFGKRTITLGDIVLKEKIEK